jgi:hypothetical protein
MTSAAAKTVTTTAPPVGDLKVTLATRDAERLAALKLIASSIAQQRQFLNRCVIWHPLTLGGTLLLFALITRLNYRRGSDDLGTLVILLAGVSIALLSALRRFGVDYLEEAERVGSPDGLERLRRMHVVVAVWKGEVVGAVAVRERAEVWAWTVVLRYRGKGLGRDLLEAAVEMCGAERFAGDHASMCPHHGGGGVVKC